MIIDPLFHSLQAEWVRTPGEAVNEAALVDWLIDNGHDLYAGCIKSKTPVLHSIASYDWAKAFEYAGEVCDYKDTYSTDGSPSVAPAKHGDLSVPTSPFNRRCVNVVHALSEGERDGASWLCVGSLYDGRFFALKAGCDFTGWD